jgi:hypothetical protein
LGSTRCRQKAGPLRATRRTVVDRETELVGLIPRHTPIDLTIETAAIGWGVNVCHPAGDSICFYR